MDFLKDYLFIVLADFLLDTVFVGNKKYRERAGSSTMAGLRYTVLTDFTIALAAFIANGASLHITPFSALMATLQTPAFSSWAAPCFC